MPLPPANLKRELTALLVSPDRELASQLSTSAAEAKTFQVLADLKSYPPQQTLDMRLRQLRPDVVLVDVASDEAAACDLINFIVKSGAETHIVALHREGAADAILRSVRAGAAEFLHAPFDAATQREAVARLLRLQGPEAATEPELGLLAAFSSVKAGSGASTLAIQTAWALSRVTGKRVLLADLDFTGGLVAFYLKLGRGSSILDALEDAERLDPEVWESGVAHLEGLDVLCAPPAPTPESVDAGRLQALLDFARSAYEFVIVDLPPVFQRISLLTISQADRAFLVSTSELPSLHLARKAATMLDRLGFPKERFNVIANRVNRRDGISKADMEKLFNLPVHASLPDDAFSLHRVIVLGEPLASEGELGKAIRSLASSIAGPDSAGKKSSPAPEMKPAFSAL